MSYLKKESAIELALLGPEGTYSHLAAKCIFNADFKACFCRSIAEVVDVAQKGLYPLGLLPLENNTAGFIGMSLDPLIASDLRIFAEYHFPVCHSLLSKEKRLEDVNVLYSLSEPYLQSGRFIQEKLAHCRWEPCSSSTAALESCLNNPVGTAAIGYSLSGISRGLGLLEENIQDLEDNYTRFAVVGHKDPELFSSHPANRSTLVFTLDDKPGTLLDVLKVFEKYSLNLCHIESRPTRMKKWNYYFVISIENPQNPASLEPALCEVEKLTPWCRQMGTYPLLNRGNSPSHTS